MKKIEQILVIFLIIGLVLKYFYLPFSSLLLVLSIMFLSSFYLVLSFALFNKIRLREILKDDSYKATNSKNIIISVFSGFSFSIVLIGILFKLLLWPGGQIQLTVGIVSLMFSVLIVFTLIKKDRAFFILKRAFLFLGISSFLYFISNETLLNHYYPNNPAYVEASLNYMKNPTKFNELQRNAARFEMQEENDLKYFENNNNPEPIK